MILLQNVPDEPEWLFMSKRLQDVFCKFPVKKKGHFENSCKLAQFIKDSFDIFWSVFNNKIFSSVPVLKWCRSLFFLIMLQCCVSAGDGNAAGKLNSLARLDIILAIFAISATELYHSIEKLFTTWDFQQLLRRKIPGWLQRMPKREWNACRDI